MGNTGIKLEMDLSKLQELTEAKAKAEARAAELEAQIAAAQFATVPGLDAAKVALDAARRVMGWTIGNFHYDDIRNWPWAELEAFLNVFEKLPGLTVDDTDWIADTRSFIKGAKLRDEERKNRQPGDKPTPLAL